MVDEVGAAQVVHLLLPARGQRGHQLLGPLVPLLAGLLPALTVQETHVELLLKEHIDSVKCDPIHGDRLIVPFLYLVHVAMDESVCLMR